MKLLEGKFLVQDLPLAAKLFENVCSANRTDGEGAEAKQLSCHNLASLYAIGSGVPQDAKRAAALLTRACDLGYAASCHDLALSYQLGQGTAQDLTKAVQLYDSACAAGFIPSCTNLGNFYVEGLGGVQRDRGKALALYEKACSGGSEKGCSALKVLKRAGPR